MSDSFLSFERLLMRAASDPTVALVGLGAIGSPTADAVARMRAVRGAILIDPDRVESGNLWTQHVLSTDVGHPKVTVHRRRMRRINPDLVVQTWDRRVQSVPLGVLRGTIILSAPDSRAARRDLGEIAWLLGAVLIDAGVESTGELLRVTIYVPGPATACVVCLFSDDDFRDISQRYPCARQTPSFATNAPFSLALAASAHQTLELHKLLAGAHEQLLASRQLVIDCRHHRHFVTTLRRSPNCRFSHEPPPSIQDLVRTPAELTWDGLLAIVSPDDPAATLSVPTTAFVARLTCRTCGRQRPVFRLANRLRPAHQRCRSCGDAMMASALDVHDRITAASLPDTLRGRPLSALGLEPADIVAIGTGSGTQYVQLGAADRARRQQDLHDDR